MLNNVMKLFNSYDQALLETFQFEYILTNDLVNIMFLNDLLMKAIIKCYLVLSFSVISADL